MRKLILCNILILPTLFSCVEAAPAITVTWGIVDGDTLEVKDEGELIRIRLVDIDAPEKASRSAREPNRNCLSW